MTNIIGVKELYKNLHKVAAKTKKGQSFLVMKHMKPLFEINPVHTTTTGQRLLGALKKMQIKSGDPDLSKKVDEIVYGGKL